MKDHEKITWWYRNKLDPKINLKQQNDLTHWYDMIGLNDINHYKF